MKANKIYNTEKLKERKFKSKRAEFIAWALFFGLGVSYFLITLIISL